MYLYHCSVNKFILVPDYKRQHYIERQNIHEIQNIQLNTKHKEVVCPVELMYTSVSLHILSHKYISQ